MRLYQAPFTRDNLSSSWYGYLKDPSKGSVMFRASYIQVTELNGSGLITVIDLVYFYMLKEIELDRASYSEWAKQFIPRRRTQLIAAGRTQDAVKFVNDSKLFVAWILSEIDTGMWTFYMGHSWDNTDMLMALKHTST